MAEPAVSVANRREQRQQQRDERRARTAAIATGAAVEVVDRSPQLSYQATVMQQAFPADLLSSGQIVRQAGQTTRGQFAPQLFLRNPQHGRTVERIVEQLMSSFAVHGQQEPILARLITEADRQIWPQAASGAARFFIIDGHQRWAAVSAGAMERVWAEIVLPSEGENEIEYRRRCLTMSSIKMMQSQAYDVFDKVNQVRIWMQEFAVPQLPSKRELAETCKRHKQPFLARGLGFGGCFFHP